MNISHLNSTGKAYMPDVTQNSRTLREATATGLVKCSPTVLLELQENTAARDELLATARLSGIAGSKRLPELLPLAQNISVHACDVAIKIEADHIFVSSTVRAAGYKNVEVEALASVLVTALALVDLLKNSDRQVCVSECKIVHKSGGRSGEWHRPSDF